jgi:hypothetical protein
MRGEIARLCLQMLFEIEIGAHANTLVMPGLAAFAKASAGQHGQPRRSLLTAEVRLRTKAVGVAGIRASIHLRKKFHSKRTDCRVKPGNDE